MSDGTIQALLCAKKSFRRVVIRQENIKALLLRNSNNGDRMVELLKSPQIYDACIVGSGAAGGVAAKVLTEGGLRVVLLEAGPLVNPQEFKQHVWPYELPLRGIGPGGDGDDLMAPNGYWSIKGEPYARAPGSRFLWFRSRIVGGRTNHWGQGFHRFDESDFKARSKDGAGDDWPLSLRDIEPFYMKVESFIGAYGSDKPTMPSPPPRCTEKFIKKACDKIGLPCTVSAGSILTRPLNGRPACHYCGQCWRGCKDASNFSSSQVLLPAAVSTGRLTLVTNAMAREIVVEVDGKAKAVSFINKLTRREQQVHARAFVLAASPCESARLLLNSKSTRFPNGLANSSGVVGRYLRDSVKSGGSAYFPQLEQIPPHNHDGMGRPHLWIPANPPAHGDFLRGYHLLFVGGRNMPLISEFDEVCERCQGYGLPLKQACRRQYGAIIRFVTGGEMIANADSYCELHPHLLDEWGIPILRFHFRWGENEIKMARHMQETIRRVVEAGGGAYLTRCDGTGELPYALAAGGQSFHEQGTIRMGLDARTSALNEFCQAHDVSNLFVMDAACFVSSSHKPPTCTIMALAWRASEYLLDQARKGQL